MVGARVRRQQVAYAQGRGLSSRRACALLSIARSTLGYVSRLATRDAPAVAAMREGRVAAARVLMLLTALAGIAFTVGQGLEFHALATTRHVGLTADHAAAIFYVITGYHGLHVLAGVLILAVVASRPSPRSPAPAGRNGAPDAQARARIGTLEVVSLYWQFVDLLWIVLFTALYLLPPVVRGDV